MELEALIRKAHPAVQFEFDTLPAKERNLKVTLLSKGSSKKQVIAFERKVTGGYPQKDLGAFHKVIADFAASK